MFFKDNYLYVYSYYGKILTVFNEVLLKKSSQHLFHTGDAFKGLQNNHVIVR